jgi:hypothetical protein
MSNGRSSAYRSITPVSASPSTKGLSNAVKHVFVTLYNEGLIYQGERIINWDPELRTALSNIEVIHKDDEGEFFYFSYDVVDSDKKVIVATTRPETMFGDTAVFVNPKDKRYKDLVGQESHQSRQRARIAADGGFLCRYELRDRGDEMHARPRPERFCSGQKIWFPPHQSAR